MSPSRWTDGDAKLILNSSPWAKRVGETKVTIRWESARPIRLALARLNAKQMIDDNQSCYAVAVVGLTLSDDLQRPEATLKATGRRPLAASDVRIQDGIVLFLFPRSEEVAEPIVFRFPLGLKIGNAVEFQARIGAASIRQKFSLKSMSYMGTPEF